MDHTVSQQCQIYQLEDVRIKAEETPDELLDHLRALANRCNFPTDGSGGGSGSGLVLLIVICCFCTGVVRGTTTRKSDCLPVLPTLLQRTQT